MKPEVVYPDGEDALVDYLLELIAERDIAATVGNNVPTSWISTNDPHILVQSDGTSEIVHPVAAFETVRVTVMARYTSQAKTLARELLGALLAYPGTPGVGSVTPLTGPLPARDDQLNAELASVTVRVSVTAQVAE